MENHVTFRLSGGKKRGSFALKGTLASKEGKLKGINYYPGSHSFYDEDNRGLNGTGIKPQLVFFKCNNKVKDLAVEIKVPIENQLLIEYLKTHPMFNKRYFIYDPAKVLTQKLSDFEKKEKALELIKEKDDTKLKALAIALLGHQYLGKDLATLKLKLKETAFETPDKIISAKEDSGYDIKYLSALAFVSGIIKQNPTGTAVLWTDNEGKIIDISTGENPLDKMAKFIATKTEESTSVFKELNNRLNADAYQMYDKEVVGLEEVKVELEDYREMYEQKFGKQVPPAQRNNLNWIKNKLSEE